MLFHEPYDKIYQMDLYNVNFISSAGDYHLYTLQAEQGLNFGEKIKWFCRQL